MMDTQNLLAEYARNGSDHAFRELANRYVDLVYSTALRLVNGDAHRAEDVAQTVFTDLARQVRTLPADVKLGGWLHRHTCFVAINLMRGERRRQSREREAVAMNALYDNSGADFSQVGPILDETINQLGEEDRTAILLRYFEQRDFRSVGEALGSNEDAARMRVTRALEKLHSLLKQRGITTGVATLGVALSTNAVQSAPVGLAATLSTSALAGTVLSTSTAVAATKIITMTALQKTLIAASVVVLAGAGIYEAHKTVQLNAQNQTLRQQQSVLATQIRQLQQERDDATNQLAGLLMENGLLKSNSNENELLKLRAEVTQLQDNKNDPTGAAAKAWLDRVNQLKQWSEQNPAATIPEFQLLTKQDWLNAARGDLKTDDDYRRAMSSLRRAAEDKFAEMLQPALGKYLQANNGQFPTDLSQLQSYLQSPVDDTIWQRWAIVPAKTVPNVGVGEPNIITEKAAVDDLLDSRMVIGSRGFGNTDFLGSEVNDIMAPVRKAYAEAHSGDWTGFQYSDLLNFAKTPEQEAAVQKLIAQQQLRSSP